MGLFDALAKNALGNLLGGSAKQDPAALLSGLLSEAGGLQGLMGKFQSAGLGDHFASWIGHGDNQSVSADDMHNAVGAEALQGVATKLGMNVQTILPLLAQFLPQIIDKLTPNGQIDENHPTGERLQSVLASVMSGGLGGLLGGKS